MTVNDFTRIRVDRNILLIAKFLATFKEISLQNFVEDALRASMKEFNADYQKGLHPIFSAITKEKSYTSIATAKRETVKICKMLAAIEGNELQVYIKHALLNYIEATRVRHHVELEELLKTH